MLLKKYFESLEKTVFGPWLAKYKILFTEEELSKETLDVQICLNEKDLNCKIVILYNDVIKINHTVLSPTRFIVEINKHEIWRVFTEITNTQLREFSKFILNLPQNTSEYKEYFVKEASTDGYSKITAFKNIPKKNELVTKFSQSQNQEHKDNHEKISQKVQELQTYLDYPIVPEIIHIGEGVFQQCDYV